MEDGFRPARPALGAAEPLLLLGCAFVATLLLARSFPIQSDEGYTLNAAWQLWTGMRMYDDFRLFVGPGSGYAVYAIWRLVGSPSFLAARLLSVALSFWGTTGFYLVLRRLGTRGGSLALGVGLWLSTSWLYVLLNHNPFSSFAAIWFLLALIRAVQARSAGRDVPRDYALAGAAAGAVFLFLPMKGGLLVACVAAFLLVTGRPRAVRPVLWLAAGFALVIAPMFVAWSPVTLVQQWVLIPLSGNYLGHTGASHVFAVAAVAVVAGMAWAAIKLSDPVLQALTWVQAAMFLAMAHNMEANHFAINAFPAMAFAAFVWQKRAARRRAGGEIPAAAVIAVGVAALLLTMLVTPGGARYAEASVLKADLLGKHPRPRVNERVARAHAIYAGPFLPSVYYLLRKNNPFFVSETVVCNQDCQLRLLAQLKEVKPELAFLNYEMIDHLQYPQTGPVDVYLREHYTPCPTEGIPVRAIDPSWCP
jgi:hypothetical protein